MKPTLNARVQREWILVDKLAARGGSLHRGDIVVFKSVVATTGPVNENFYLPDLTCLA